jgi:predicted PurR-regulated permease PerM
VTEVRVVLRTVLVVVTVVFTLYMLYLLRTPLTWIVIAGFMAIALSGPVNFMERWLPRGLAIASVYLALILVPVLLAAAIVPSLVEEGDKFINNVPQYADDLQSFVQKNKRLRDLEDKYDVTQKIQEEAKKLPQKIPDAVGALQDIGAGIVSSVFALVTILILSVFMVSSGRGWVERLIELQPVERRERLRRTADRIGAAVGNYVAGALVQATIAGFLAFIVLKILGVPFAAPLALVMAFGDLIPLVGATIAAFVIGIVTLFEDFPTATIIWVIWSVVYQQLENTLVQPQIQKRAVNVHPFAVLVSVLFGSTLFGLLGALLAIPFAASIQIIIREWWNLRVPEPADLEPPEPPESPDSPEAGTPGPGPPPPEPAPA